MASLFAKVKIYSFWPKTMDYSPWFQSDFFPHSKLHCLQIQSYIASLHDASGLKTIKCHRPLAPNHGDVLLTTASVVSPKLDYLSLKEPK